MKHKSVVILILCLAFLSCVGDKKPTSQEYIEQKEDTKILIQDQYVHIADSLKSIGEDSAAVDYYVRALRIYYESANFDEGVFYARKVLVLDPNNEYAKYVHDQLLPPPSDVYLPGFDDDINDEHDMELYFSDPYF